MKSGKYIDLQIHSDYSDGLLSPKNIVEKAKKANLAVIALTDHDVIDGVSEAVAHGKKTGVKVIAGVELYASFQKKDLHILGYGIDLNNKILNNALRKIQGKHLQKVAESIEKLKKSGFIIDFNGVRKTKSKYIGISHIVSHLWKNKGNRLIIKRQIKSHYITLPLIAAQYFIPHKSAYLPQESIPASDAIKLIKGAGGLPVLAHPGQQLTWKDDYIIKDLKEIGIKGMEVLSPYHNWHQTEHYQKIASLLNLVPTGGSDFHGDLPLEKHMVVRNQWDYFKVPYQIYLNLRKYLKYGK